MKTKNTQKTSTSGCGRKTGNCGGKSTKNCK